MRLKQDVLSYIYALPDDISNEELYYRVELFLKVKVSLGEDEENKERGSDFLRILKEQ